MDCLCSGKHSDDHQFSFLTKLDSISYIKLKKTCQSLTLDTSVGEVVSAFWAPVHYQNWSGRRTDAPLHPSTPKQVGRVGSVPRASRKWSNNSGKDQFSIYLHVPNMLLWSTRSLLLPEKSSSSPFSLSRTRLNSWQFLLFTLRVGQHIASLFVCLIYCRSKLFPSCFLSEHEWLWKEGNLKYWQTWPMLQTITDLKSEFPLTCSQ